MILTSMNEKQNYDCQMLNRANASIIYISSSSDIFTITIIWSSYSLFFTQNLYIFQKLEKYRNTCTQIKNGPAQTKILNLVYMLCKIF